MKRGEVYWADLAPRSGSEQRGRRPVVVISHDAFNQTPGWRSIIVVPLSTSVAQAGRGPSAVLLSQSQPGQCCPLSSSDHAGSRKVNAANWRIEFNGIESGRRWHQGRNGLAVASCSRVTAREVS